MTAPDTTTRLATGRALAGAIGAWLVLLGLGIALNTPPLSGGTISGALLILTGGGLIAWAVGDARRQS